MLKINKIITKFLFILSVSFFLASNVFAGGAIIENVPDTKINEVKEVKIEKNNTKVEILNQKLSSPTILSPKNDDIVSYDETITGAVSSGAVVRIYIDGILDGEIKSWESKTGVSAFFYKPKQHLSEGIHFIKAQTVKNGFISDFSREILIIKESAYEAPIVKTPYYYKDDYKTFVVRGTANSNDLIDIYLDNKKIKTLKLGESKRKDNKVDFLYAIHNLKDGKHSGYFVAYENGSTKRSYDSKKFYFEVKNPSIDQETVINSIEDDTNDVNKEPEKIQEKNEQEKINKEINKEEVGNKEKEQIKETTKIEDKDTTIDKKDSNILEEKSSSDYEKNKSMTIGIVLLICSIVLMIFWIYSENQERIKKFIDRLLDEDYEDEKDNKNKK